MRSLLLLLFFIPLLTVAQDKKITLEDIYKKGTFRGEPVRGLRGAVREEGLFDPTTLMDEKGQRLQFEDYTLSGDRKRILFFNGREPIYRHSSRSTVYLYDVTTKKALPLNEGKVLHATFSPDGSRIAYVFNNNLYLYEVANGKTVPVTTDGKWNHIINGNADWVYEEEFSFTQAYQWSPGGAYLAYYRFDETDVKEFNMTLFDDSYNADYRYKYPKAGEKNSKVSIHIYNVANGATANARVDTGDIYIPRIRWMPSDAGGLLVTWMNRHQNHLKLLRADPATGATTPIYEERNKYYVDIHDDWHFLKDGKDFIFTSEMGGYNSLYRYSVDGSRKVPLSKIPYDLTEVNGVDEAARLVYYTLAYPTPMDRNLFVTDFDGKATYQLTQGRGWHRVELNEGFTQFQDYHSDINTPQVVTLYDIKKDKRSITAVRKQVVSESAKLKSTLSQYALGKAEFIRIPNSKGDTLNGWMLKPANFDPAKKYPVLFCNYGGPGSQQVANRFGAASMWHQMLAQNGMIVVSVDGTGTGYRGEEFKKKTYLRLGQLEIEDQIDAARYIGALPFIDRNRIGHWGWSFGGFMSSLAITKGADVFKAAVAVAPVTNWRYYDNIYTERFMRTPQENPLGYDTTAPINFVDRIRGKYLLIHGAADDNVHFQNSARMVTALVKANVDFESAYYPNKNHGISGQADNTTFHLYRKMTSWIYANLRDNTAPVGGPPQTGERRAF